MPRRSVPRFNAQRHIDTNMSDHAKAWVEKAEKAIDDYQHVSVFAEIRNGSDVVSVVPMSLPDTIVVEGVTYTVAYRPIKNGTTFKRAVAKANEVFESDNGTCFFIFGF